MTKVTNKAPKRPQVKSEMDFMTLFEKFGNDEKCRMYLEKLRWPERLRCVRCGSDKVSHIYKRNQFACDSCQYHYSVTAGTIFHDSHLPLMKWFAAIYLLSESKKGMSALQLKRTLKVAYKTAWYLCHRIREAVKDADVSMLDGLCEVDEAYIGGKPINMHKKRREKIRKSPKGYEHKTMVLGAIERGGNVRLQLSSKRRLRRSIVGSYHQISVKHLDRYLDEFEFRFNNRNNPYLFRDTLLRLLASSNLEYKELTKDQAA
jgi:transposase-like protein